MSSFLTPNDRRLSLEHMNVVFWVPLLIASFFSTGSLSQELALPFALTASPNSSQFQHKTILPLGECLETLSTDNTFAETERVIRASNEAFKRRGWSEDFLEERVGLAYEFRHQSRYDYLELKDSGLKGAIVGTIGITVATYGTKTKQNEILVMERSHGWKLKRPRSRRKKGVIFELRTYSMGDSISSLDQFTYLFFHSYFSIQEIVKKVDPILMDEKIIYTYGDHVSERLYRSMGFEIIDAPGMRPKNHLGSTWKVLRISPRELLRNTRRLQHGYRLLYKEGRTVALPGGFKAVFLRPHIISYFGKDVILNIKPEVETEVAAGVWAQPDTNVSWYEDGRLKSVVLAKPYKINDGLIASAGSEVKFDHIYNRVFVTPSEQQNK